MKDISWAVVVVASEVEEVEPYRDQQDATRDVVGGDRHGDEVGEHRHASLHFVRVERLPVGLAASQVPRFSSSFGLRDHVELLAVVHLWLEQPRVVFVSQVESERQLALVALPVVA